MPSFLQSKKVQVILGLIVLYLATFGVSYFAFNIFLKKPISITTPFGNLTDVTSNGDEGVKDKACPINGVLYSKARLEQWQNRRPLGIMVENHLDSRPVFGISRADAVYEAVAEGGITRFLSIFYCQDAGDIAPVRSARTYFLDWVTEYDAAYAHVGGANTPGPANALGQIRDYGIKDMDQFGLGFPTYWRGTDKLAPHNVHTTTKKLWEAAEKKNFGAEDEKGIRWDKNFIEWKFKDEESLEKREDQKPIIVPFWATDGNYTVTWNYDKTANVYKRSQNNSEQTDPLTKELLSPKNIVVQFQTERNANDGYPDGHLLYGTTGSGKALIFQDGKVIIGKWNKASRTARSKFTNIKGQEIQFNRGQIWIQTIPVGNDVQY